MLQTILMLAALAVLIALGIWMAFLGHRVYRVFAVLFGLMVGGCGVLFLAGELGWALTSMIVLIGAPVLGILLGVLGAFVRIAGTGLGGILAGYLYGTGLIFSIDTLLGGAIPPLFYTALSMVLLLGICVFCMIRPRQGAVISTAFVGSYMVVFGVTLIATWMLSGGASSQSLLTENANAMAQLGELIGMLSDKTHMLVLLTAFVLGLGCATFQFRVLHCGARNRGEIDWDAIDEEMYEDEDDTYQDEAEEAFEDEEEEIPVKRRRGLFGRRRREEEQADWEEEDSWEDEEEEDDFEGEKAQGEDASDLSQDEDLRFSREEAARLRALRGAEAAAAVQPDVPDSQPAPAPKAEQTQVFRRVDVQRVVQTAQEQASHSHDGRQDTAPIRKQPERRVPPAEQSAHSAHDSLDAPRFAPRASRRKGR